MEIREGYKMTEIGVIPEDWEVKTLKESCSKITDGTHDTPKPIKNGVPFLTAIHVRENYIDFRNCYYLPEHIHKTIYSRCNPQFGDVLMVNIGSGTATTALVNVDYEFSLKNVALLKPNKKKLNGAYLNYFQLFQKSKIVESLSSGGAQPFLSLNQIGNILFASPKTIEQNAIAKVLSDTDALIQSLEKLIAKKQSIKQGTMQLLLTGKKRLPGFSGEWEVKKLGQIATLATGSTPPPNDRSNYGDEFLFVSPADLGKGKYIFNTEKKLSEKGFQISRKFPKKSILFTCIGSTIGKCGITNNELTSNQQINAVLPSKNFDSEYLYYALDLMAPSIRALAGEQAVPLINKTQFGETPIYLPCAISEQAAIADILSDVDEELTALENKLSKYKLIKQGMMQNLLTGKIRLV